MPRTRRPRLASPALAGLAPVTRPVRPSHGHRDPPDRRRGASARSPMPRSSTARGLAKGWRCAATPSLWPSEGRASALRRDLGPARPALVGGHDRAWAMMHSPPAEPPTLRRHPWRPHRPTPSPRPARSARSGARDAAALCLPREPWRRHRARCVHAGARRQCGALPHRCSVRSSSSNVRPHDSWSTSALVSNTSVRSTCRMCR